MAEGRPISLPRNLYSWSKACWLSASLCTPLLTGINWDYLDGGDYREDLPGRCRHPSGRFSFSDCAICGGDAGAAWKFTNA